MPFETLNHYDVFGRQFGKMKTTIESSGAARNLACGANPYFYLKSSINLKLILIKSKITILSSA